MHSVCIESEKKKKISRLFWFLSGIIKTRWLQISEQFNNAPTTTTTEMSHTILLVQPGTRPETRTYSDYESVNECMEGVCKIYEEHLKRRNPNTPTITYDISQLFDFLDQVRWICVGQSVELILCALTWTWLVATIFTLFFLLVSPWSESRHVALTLNLLLLLYFTVGRFKLLGLSKINEYICTVQ